MSDRFEGDDLKLRDALRALRVDPPADEFQRGLRRKLLAAGPPRSPSPWRRLLDAARLRPGIVWPALGAAAGLLVFAAAGVIRAPPGAVPAGVAILPATQVAVVRVSLSADVAVEGARIRVTLPPELSFWADGQALPQRSFEWTQALRAGDNEIPIAVRGQRPGRYRISVTARIGDERVDDEIELEVTRG